MRYTNLAEIKNITNLDTSNVTERDGLFYECLVMYQITFYIKVTKFKKK